MSKTTGGPDTWYLTQSDVNNHVEHGTTGTGLLQVTNPENTEDPGLIDSIDASEVTSYLADPTSIKGIGLRNKWKWNIIRKYGHNGLAYDPKTKKMYPGVEEAIAKLPTKYQHFIKFDMGADLTAHAANAGKNAFADFAFRYGVPTMLTIAGLGPLATSIGSVGFFPTVLNTATGFGTGYLGSKIGEWGGQKLDERFGTNYWTPTLSLAGGITGGFGESLLSNKLMFNSVKNNFSRYDPTSRRSQFNSKVFGQDFLDDASQAAHLDQLRNVEEMNFKLNTPSPQRTDFTINAPGNAEGMPIIYGPTFAGPYKWQNMLSLKQNAVPSRLSALELQGTPKHNRIFNTHNSHIVSELPESAFIPKQDPLSAIRPQILSNSQQQFVDDVTNGAYFARRESLLPDPTPREFIFAEGNLLDPEIKIKVKGSDELIPMTRMGSGAESDVYYDPVSQRVMKFSFGDRIEDFRERYLRGEFQHDGSFKKPEGLWKDFHLDYRRTSNHYNIVPKIYTSPEELIADYQNYVKDLNKYWFTEPQYFEGYYKQWNGTYRPVLSQKMLPFPSKMSPTNTGAQQKSYMIPVSKNDPASATPILRNNIMLENDLPMPLDAHGGNFRFDENGILRGSDIHKNGGKIRNVAKWRSKK